jgi:hypothetical protein
MTQEPYTAHSTTISAAALAARVEALEAQVQACLKTNAGLIARIVELEAERDVARLTIRKARQRLYDAHGRTAHETYLVILSVGKILREEAGE